MTRTKTNEPTTAEKLSIADTLIEAARMYYLFDVHGLRVTGEGENTLHRAYEHEREAMKLARAIVVEHG